MLPEFEGAPVARPRADFSASLRAAIPRSIDAMALATRSSASAPAAASRPASLDCWPPSLPLRRRSRSACVSASTPPKRMPTRASAVLRAAASRARESTSPPRAAPAPAELLPPARLARSARMRTFCSRFVSRASRSCSSSVACSSSKGSVAGAISDASSRGGAGRGNARERSGAILEATASRRVASSATAASRSSRDWT
mmetsp:Transcript_107656/g.300786  ORF Transcript_107656/g.300786 Transcript_107656/m.300786 type:complete len:200 (-) Transcript_107656:1585-2184(-)